MNNSITKIEMRPTTVFNTNILKPNTVVLAGEYLSGEMCMCKAIIIWCSDNEITIEYLEDTIYMNGYLTQCYTIDDLEQEIFKIELIED